MNGSKTRICIDKLSNQKLSTNIRNINKRHIAVIFFQVASQVARGKSVAFLILNIPAKALK